MLSASLVVVGVVGFETFGTAQVANSTVDSARVSAVKTIESSDANVGPTEVKELTSLPNGLSPGSQATVLETETPDQGESFGLVYVPRLRDKAWAQPLLSGIEADQLNAGIGHFPHSVLPGQVGNFAIAGHRATYGEPFAFIDQLKSGDRVIIRTNAGWYVYSLTKDKIVKPEDVWVVDPVPGDLSATPTEAIMTIVTCEPRWGSEKRWIWWGELIEVLPADSPPAEILKFGEEPI
jgi:sortase A